MNSDFFLLQTLSVYMEVKIDKLLLIKSMIVGDSDYVKENYSHHNHIGFVYISYCIYQLCFGG